MTTHLPPLALTALRDGALSDDVREQVVGALRRLGWSEDEVGGLALDAADDRAALADVLEGVVQPSLAQALRDEAGEPSAFDPGPIGLAVQQRAGEVDLVAEILGRTSGVVPHDAVGRAVRHDAGPVDLADAVLVAVGGAPAAPIADAFEALGGVDVAEAVMGRVAPAALQPDWSRALSSAAPPIDLADGVMGALGLAPAAQRPARSVEPVRTRAPQADVDPDALLSALLDKELSGEPLRQALARIQDDRAARIQLTGLAETGRFLREAIEGSRGRPPFLWPAVARAIGIADPERVEGWDDRVLPAAVRQHAGATDVADAVMETLGAAQPYAVRDVVVPTPVNVASWSVVAALVAAALWMLVVVPRVVTPAEEPEFREVPAAFAAAGEINVDEIRSGERASVYVETPVDASSPLIIWVDDGGAR